jgi:FPC/CPF motif-containing protein YcgG
LTAKTAIDVPSGLTEPTAVSVAVTVSFVRTPDEYAHQISTSTSAMNPDMVVNARPVFLAHDKPAVSAIPETVFAVPPFSVVTHAMIMSFVKLFENAAAAHVVEPVL